MAWHSTAEKLTAPACDQFPALADEDADEVVVLLVVVVVDPSGLFVVEVDSECEDSDEDELCGDWPVALPLVLDRVSPLEDSALDEAEPSLPFDCAGKPLCVCVPLRDAPFPEALGVNRSCKTSIVTA